MALEENECVSKDPQAAEPTELSAPSKAEYDPFLLPQSTIYYDRDGAKIEDPRITDLVGRKVNILVNREAEYGAPVP